MKFIDDWKERERQKEENAVPMKDLLDAEVELMNLKAEHGIEDTHKGPISKMFELRESRPKRLVKKSTYLKLMLLGAFGVHRFYVGKNITGIIYLATCWTGFSLANTLIDLLQVIPMEPDENGMVLI